MIIEAGLFHFPAKIWAVLSKTSGLNLAGMIGAVVKAEEGNVRIIPFVKSGSILFNGDR